MPKVMVIPDDFEQNRQRAEDSARRFAAAVAGAVEGFFQAFEEHRVAEEAKESIRNAGEVARAVTQESRAQAQTPEMQELGHDLKKMGVATADATRTAANAVMGVAGNATDAVKGAASDARHGVAGAAHDAADAVRHKVDNVKHRVEHAKEEVKVRADAVAETGRRARVAPGRITNELKGAYRAWMRGIVTAIALGFVMAVFAIVTLVVLTIALVVGLNALVGDPAGTWIVALLYTLVIVAAYFVMRSRREAAARESERHIVAAGEEIRHVGAPVRSAFSGRGRAGF